MRKRHDRASQRSAALAMRLLLARSDEERRRIISQMTFSDALAFDADFEAWAHKSQLQPITEGSDDHADGLRGPEHDFAWADEFAKWRQAEESWMNLQFGLRRGPSPRALITTTPRSMELLQRMIADPWTVTTGGKTSNNINLDKKVIEVLTATYGRTRIGRQELNG